MTDVLCGYCSEDLAVGELETRDDAVGYRETIQLCRRCMKEFGQEEEG